MTTITVSSKGQIAIPKEFRERFDIRAGAKLALRAEGQELILRKASGSDWRQMRGSFKGKSLVAARRQERMEELARESKGVVDSWALMAWIQGQPAAERVQVVLDKASSGRLELWISMINVGEIYYLLAKRLSVERAEDFLKQFPTLPMRAVVPDGNEIIDAARLKGRYRISYADSFAASLAIGQRVPLITGDPDFHRMSKIVDLDWIG